MRNRSPLVGPSRSQAAERERPLVAALDEPEPVLAGDLARLVTAHLARPKAARLTPPPDPVDHRAHAEPEPLRRLVAGQTLDLDRPHCTLPQIHRISSAHASWPPN